jgi:hypothetical protein
MSTAVAGTVSGTAVELHHYRRLDSCELHDLLADLDWTPAGHCFLLAERRRIPETQLR